MCVTPLRRSWLVFCAVVPLTAVCSVARAETSGPKDGMAPAEIAQQVRALEAAVDADHERLLLLVSTPRAKSATPLHAEPELKEIARRLPALQAELIRWADAEGPQRADPPGQPARSVPPAPTDAAAKAQP